MFLTRENLTILTNTSDNHSKYYSIWIAHEGGFFKVMFAYGKIGAENPNIGSKGQYPQKSSAVGVANQLILDKKKSSKGYSEATDNEYEEISTSLESIVRKTPISFVEVAKTLTTEEKLDVPKNALEKMKNSYAFDFGTRIHAEETLKEIGK